MEKESNNTYNIGDFIGTVIITSKENGFDKNGWVIKYCRFKCSCGFDCGEHYSKGKLIKDFKILETALRNGTSCSCCCTPPQITVTNINSMWKTDYWMIELGVDEEFAKKCTRSSGLKVRVICPDCGREAYKKPNNIYKRKSISCSCGDGFSFGHKYVFNLLTQLQLESEQNKTFDWCNYPDYKDDSKISKGEYDFVIENKKLIIEVDGAFHRTNNKMSGQIKEHSKYLDDMKDKLAKENGYKVIRISDDGNIKDNILNSKLNILFNLSKIDWLKCEIGGLSNISKKVCDMWNSGKYTNCLELSKLNNVGTTTINNWLHAWVKLGLCTYNGEEVMNETYKNSGKRFKEKYSKRVEIFKDGISLGIFESCTELERQSIGLFGVKLSQPKIGMVSNGVRSHHKGYTFKYVS